MKKQKAELVEMINQLPVKDNNLFCLSIKSLRKQKKELKRIKKFGYGV